MLRAVAERGLRHPDVAGAVRDRVAVGILRRSRRVVRPGRVARVGSRHVLAHLCIGSGRRCSRARGSACSPRSTSPRIRCRSPRRRRCRSAARSLSGSPASWAPLRDPLRRHVRRADDLLALSCERTSLWPAMLNTSDADAERDQDHARRDAAPLQELPLVHAPLLSSDRRRRRADTNACKGAVSRTLRLALAAIDSRPRFDTLDGTKPLEVRDDIGDRLKNGLRRKGRRARSSRQTKSRGSTAKATPRSTP